MSDLFRFIGKDGSLGYKNGKIYMLTILVVDKPKIIKPYVCPYSSWETFFENWERI